jgi:hypothetical protein
MIHLVDLECRNLDVSKKLWGERASCFEKPQIGIKPSEVRFTLLRGVKAWVKHDHAHYKYKQVKLK